MRATGRTRGGVRVGRQVLCSAASFLCLASGARATCVGDCDDDQSVTVDELLIGVGIALGQAPLSLCPPFDVRGAGVVTVDGLLLAVNAALAGCPPPPATDTPTPSPTPSVPLALTPPMPTRTGAPSLTTPVFTDVTEAAGVGYVQRATVVTRDCFAPPTSYDMLNASIVDCWLAPMSGGVAARDYDNDGLPDLYVTRLDAPGILFHNKGAGLFEDVTEQAGLGAFANGNGAAWGDVDNDGDADLYVSTIGERRNYLFINDGNGHFTEESSAREAGVETGQPHYAQSVAFGDYDRDGWIDLYTTEWRFWDFSPGFMHSHSRLLRNRGAEKPGYFEDVTTSAGVDVDELYGFGVVTFAPAFVDLDGDGWQDLAIVADKQTSELFWNNRDGTFTRATDAGINLTSSEMGSTFADFDGDGDLDWLVTAISCQPPYTGGGDCTGNNLYRYDGNRRFTQANDAAGVRVGHWGWGAVFFDYDNDGDADLAMVNGEDIPGPFTPDDNYLDDPMVFWQNDGRGVMTEMAALVGLTDRGLGKGILSFDYDNDGDLDLFITNTGGRPRLYRNDGGNAQGWIEIKTEGRRSNRDGYGARITVIPRPGDRPQLQEVGVGSHYLGQSDLVAHFGLGSGDDPVAAVQVTWPASGQVQVFTNVARNSTLRVVEPSR